MMSSSSWLATVCVCVCVPQQMFPVSHIMLSLFSHITVELLARPAACPQTYNQHEACVCACVCACCFPLQSSSKQSCWWFVSYVGSSP